MSAANLLDENSHSPPASRSSRRSRATCAAAPATTRLWKRSNGRRSDARWQCHDLHQTGPVHHRSKHRPHRRAGQGDRPDALPRRHHLSRYAAHGDAVRRPAARAHPEHRHIGGRGRAGRRGRLHRRRCAGERVWPADQRPAGAVRAGLEQARRRHGALRGRSGGAGGGRDRGAGARRVQADPHRVGRPAARARSRKRPCSPAPTSLHPDTAADNDTFYSYRIRKGDVEAALRIGRCGHRRRVPDAGPGARLSPAGSRRGLSRRGRPRHGRGRRPVDARGPEADRARAGHPRRAGARDLPGHRRRVRRPRGYVGADHAGAGRLAAGAARHSPPGQDDLEPRGVDHRPRQAPRR